MNIVAADGLCVAYPSLTFQRRGLVPLHSISREVDDEVVGTLIWVLDVEEAVVVDTLLVVGSVVVLEGSSVDVEELSDVEVEGVDESVVVDFA